LAKPRIFISSTYYDLKSVRADLERFIRDQGFDPVLNERGGIVYTKEQSPEQGCYREIESCDILISIIGGRFGSSSLHAGPYSISQMELKTAIENNKQVYIFIERDVLTEHRTYQSNKSKDIDWTSVDDKKIFDFIEEVLSLQINNPVMPFDTSHDIVQMLREQWSGLFQRLLQQASAEGQLATARELRQGVETVRKLVDVLTSSAQNEKDSAKDAIKNILLPNHPIYRRIQKLLNSPYRIYFTNIDELNSWLNVRSFKPVDAAFWDDEYHREWVNQRSGDDTTDLLKIHVSLFDDDGQLRVESVEWKDDLVIREKRPVTGIDTDDLPF
jgi:hypothetical protein